MCIFSRRVNSVSKTNIFARVENGIQHLVYGMNFSANHEVAMILPIPIEKGSNPSFINLKDCDGFFTDMRSAFPVDPQPKTRSRGMTRSFSSPTLEVEKVGAFEASFVPSLDDFQRLDPRFRLPDGTETVMKDLYANFGFVVFKLQPGDEIKPHPMAFSFKTANPLHVFYPTIHIHDGKLKSQGDFDHNLYLQMPPSQTCTDATWTASKASLGLSMNPKTPAGLVRHAVGYRLRLKGARRNADIVVDLGKVACVT